MMTKRVLAAIGAFCLVMTGVTAPVWAMESAYRPYEPADGHDYPPLPAPNADVTGLPVPFEDAGRPAGPTFRTGDGSHPVTAPHLSLDIIPGEIPKHDTGGAGLPVWRW